MATHDSLRAVDWRRRWSVRLLRPLAVLSFLLALATGYLWWLTAVAFHKVYILRDRTSVAARGPARTWWEWLVDLDLTTFSVGIFCIFFTLLAVRGALHGFAPRDREEAREPLFPAGFRGLCIQLGLIGALVSFVLASFTMMADVESGAARAASSERLLLIIFASLTSTLAGTVVAYLLVPPLERLNSWALGAHLLPPESAESAAEHFSRAVQPVTRLLEQLNPLITGMVQWMGHVQSAGAVMAGLEGQLRLLNQHLAAAAERSRAGADALVSAGQSADAAAEALREAAGRLNQMIDGLPARLEPVQAAVEGLRVRAETVAAHLAAVAEAGADGRRLGNMVRDVVQTLVRVVHPVRDVLGTLSRGRDEDRKTLENLLSTVKGLDSLLGDPRSGIGARGQAAADSAARVVTDSLREQGVEWSAALAGITEALAGLQTAQRRQAEALGEIGRHLQGLEAMLSEHTPAPHRTNGRTSWWRHPLRSLWGRSHSTGDEGGPAT
jgi:hypothetical protein